ncbi:MAG TPA: UbiA-like polyprenyltransferase [Ktedonobacterales bacterium]
MLEAIKFEHTIFALPFAYLGMILASRDQHGWPGLDKLIWITVAMAGARTAAMALNRLIDMRLDAANPRTANRALPLGHISPPQMLALAVVSCAVLAFAAWRLNPLCLALVPLALLFLVGYSYTKRFTWLCHLILGITDGIAPIGGWLAVNPTLSAHNLLTPVLLAAMVALWVGGFDLLYSCQDIEFDRKNGLKSIPARFGPTRALGLSEMWHGVSLGLLGAVGALLGLSWPFWIGLAAAGWLLIWEHRLVQPQDLTHIDMAFFTINGYLSVAVFVCTLAAVVLGGHMALP